MPLNTFHSIYLTIIFGMYLVDIKVLEKYDFVSIAMSGGLGVKIH